MHANTGFLSDWRAEDGFFYLSYSGSTDGDSFELRWGHPASAVAPPPPARAAPPLSPASARKDTEDRLAHCQVRSEHFQLGSRPGSAVVPRGCPGTSWSW
jgi:hypothetical protein